jgi:glucosylceramidase
MFDHNKDHVITWAEEILNETHPSSKYVSGTAYHWYAGGMVSRTLQVLSPARYERRNYSLFCFLNIFTRPLQDRLLDGAVGTPNLHRLQGKLDALNVSKQHVILGSEACHCPYTGYAGGDIEIYWSRAERYAHTILADLAAGSNGWVEWNLV